MLNSFLLEKHTDGEGSIMIDESNRVLSLTAALIEQDSETDFDCLVDQLRESDELTTFLKGMVRMATTDVVISHIDLETLAENNLVETIDRLLRSGI